MELDDYLESTATLTFDSATTDNRECFSVQISDDGDFELKENFTIELSSTTAGFVDPERSVVTIFILDVNGEWEYLCHPLGVEQKELTGVYCLN